MAIATVRWSWPAACKIAATADFHGIEDQARSDSKIRFQCAKFRWEFLRNQREFSVLDENFRLARLLGCCFDFLCVFW